jgi:hypothetical protein
MVYATDTEIAPTVTSPATLQVHERAPVDFSLTSKESGVTWSATNLPGEPESECAKRPDSGSEAIPGN